MFFRYLFSKINRYFSKVFLLWNLIVMAVAVFIISLVELAEYSRRLVKSEGVSFAGIINLIVLKIPQHIQIILPFVIFIAAIITFSRLNRTSEITVVRNLGVAIRQIIAGFSVVIITVFLILIIIINPISSTLTQKQNEMESRIFSSTSIAMSVLNNGVWLRENMGERQSIINIHSLQLTDRLFNNVTFYNFSSTATMQERLFARQARIKDGEWHLEEVTIFNLGKGAHTVSSYQLKTYLTFQKILDSNLPPDFLSFWQLPDYIKLLEKSGLSAVRYSLRWHSIWGSLGVFFAMIYLAGAFSLRPVRRGGTAALVVLAVFSGLIFYFLSNVVLALGLAEKLPVLIAVWCPTIIILLLSHTLILHLEEG